MFVIIRERVKIKVMVVNENGFFEGLFEKSKEFVLLVRGEELLKVEKVLGNFK